MLSTVLPALSSAFNLNNKNVNALIARRLSGFTSTRSLLNNEIEIFNTLSLLVNSNG